MQPTLKTAMSGLKPSTYNWRSGLKWLDKWVGTLVFTQIYKTDTYNAYKKAMINPCNKS
ncbi:hypothetical protein [Limnohabitans sp. Rim8]|jgi:hypothetical protein|uniref:hypothetical protein n=1 Tax=Limnohabitans sp. Rim8 TaxID=1100718 RepID=UPI0025FD074C|nr:hypothetical protein [Limnohabitans sp. Rim8]